MDFLNGGVNIENQWGKDGKFKKWCKLKIYIFDNVVFLFLGI